MRMLTLRFSLLLLPLPLLLLHACSSEAPSPIASSGATLPQSNEAALAGTTKLQLHCKTTGNQRCVLAATAGKDVHAKRFRSHCPSAKDCQVRDGAYCIDAAPASGASHKFYGDNITCFAEHEACETFRETSEHNLNLVCAPMSARVAATELAPDLYERADILPVDDHCSDAGTSDGTVLCFTDYWSCAHRRHQWQPKTIPCERASEVHCYTSPISISLGLPDLIESCYRDSTDCKSSRAAGIRADSMAASKTTACTSRPNSSLR